MDRLICGACGRVAESGRVVAGVDAHGWVRRLVRTTTGPNGGDHFEVACPCGSTDIGSEGLWRHHGGRPPAR